MTGTRELEWGRGWPWAAAVLIVALTFAAQTARPAEPDMGYMLYVAGRLLDGAKLYRDVIDMNPPAIFLFNVPIVWLARATHLSDVLLYRFVTLLVIGSLLLFVRRLLGRYLLDGRPRERRYVLLLLCLVLFPLSREDFGQREQFVLALLVPYLTVVVARLGGRRVAAMDGVATGVLAGLALTVKPPFAIAWLIVEVWYRLHVRFGRMRLTSEVCGLTGVAAAYVVGVVTMAPDYLRLIARLAGAYTTYLRVAPLNLLLFAPGAVLTALALLAVISVRGENGASRGVVAAAMLGCFLAGVAQQKGLRYHFYPSFALATVALGLVAVVPRSTGLSAGLYVRIAKYSVATVAVLVLGASLFDLAGGGRGDRQRRAEFLELVRAVRARAGGQSIGVLSYHMGSAFPLVNYAGVSLASRFACLWILPASYWDALSGKEPIRYHAPAEMQPPERMLNEAVSQDLLGARPRLLLILRPFPDEPPYGFRRLNYVAYFGRNPKLAGFFAGYQHVAVEGQYDLYERVDSGRTRTGAPPAAAVPPLPAHAEGRLPLVDPEIAFGAAVFLAIAIGSLVRECLTRSGDQARALRGW
jgi:hypothetical protein